MTDPHLAEQLLNHVNHPRYRPVKPRTIVKQLDLPPDSLRDLRMVIKRLVKEGKLAYGSKHLVQPVGGPSPAVVRTATSPETIVAVVDDSSSNSPAKPKKKKGKKAKKAKAKKAAAPKKTAAPKKKRAKKAAAPKAVTPPSAPEPETAPAPSSDMGGYRPFSDTSGT